MMRAMHNQAHFIDRTACISCGSSALHELSSGGFGDDPLRGILESQAWGESPLPYIAHERWSYVRCEACAQTFHRRILDPQWMTTLYSQWETQAAMEAFIAKHITPQDRLHRGTSFVAHALQMQRMSTSCTGGRALRVLDYGCGHGEFVAVCRALGFDAIGIDFAPDRDKHGMVHCVTSLSDLRREHERVPQFDVVTLFEVLEHLAEPRGTLQQLAEVMPQGATLVLETPDATGVTGLRSTSDYLAIGPLGHINGFTPPTLRAIAERVGFRAVRPQSAWVTTSWHRVAKTAAKRLMAPLRRPSVSQYFVRV